MFSSINIPIFFIIRKYIYSYYKCQCRLLKAIINYCSHKRWLPHPALSKGEGSKRRAKLKSSPLERI
jgi:hypothetical protein